MNSKKKVWQSQEPARKIPTQLSRAEFEHLVKKTKELVRRDPQKAAVIIASWIDPKKSKKAA